MGESNVVLIRRKSTKFLQDYYDHLIEQKRVARLRDVTEEAMAEVNAVFRANRQLLTVVPPATMTAGPVIYPAAGVAALGAPTTANPEIICGAVTRVSPTSVDAMAPFTIALPNHNAPQHPLVHFKKLTWCQQCGFRKREHTKEERFGSYCKRNWCAHCGFLQQHHPTGRMGPFCDNEASESSPRLEWYDKK